MCAVPRAVGPAAVPGAREPGRWKLSRLSPELVGVVLCGGASRRMGRDKASMGDPPWAHRVAAALTDAGCVTVELQGGVDGLGTDAWPQVADLVPGGGPVPAIVQAAARHQTAVLVTAACDLADLGPAAVTHLVEAVASRGCRAGAYRVDGRANWSLVVLTPALTASLGELAPSEASGRSLHSLLAPEAKLFEPVDVLAVTDTDADAAADKDHGDSVRRPGSSNR